MLPDIHQIAEKTSDIVQQIISGDVFAYSPEIKEWALGIYSRFGPLSNEDDLLTLAIVDCLVDILTCDNTAWDTPIWSFVEHLHKLKSVLGSETG
jgi:hypothetical protein